MNAISSRSNEYRTEYFDVISVISRLAPTICQVIHFTLHTGAFVYLVLLTYLLTYLLNSTPGAAKIGLPLFKYLQAISASLNLDGKVAWVKDRFAKCEMRMEKVSAHDFRSDVGM